VLTFIDTEILSDISYRNGRTYFQLCKEFSAEE
jgi:hypothetical protein